MDRDTNAVGSNIWVCPGDPGPLSHLKNKELRFNQTCIPVFSLTCYGNKIHKSSWKIALQNIQCCLDIPCIRCWGRILEHIHPQRGVAHVGTGIIVPNNYGHHFPISVEVYPGIPSHRLDKSPGLSSQFYTCRARHSEIVSRCLPRANSEIETIIVSKTLISINLVIP